MKVKFATLFLSIALTAAGCSAPAAAPAAPKAPGVTEVHVKLSEFKVELDRTSIPAGPVKFLVSNTGTITHELVLEAADAVNVAMEMNGKGAEAENIGPGKTGTLEWTLDKPGTYRLACHINALSVDHFKTGMSTLITVTVA